MNLVMISQTLLFRGTTPQEADAMLNCLGAYTRSYTKGEMICRTGEPFNTMAMVLSGGVTIESDDVWGNKSILSHVGVGEVFAETYACLPGQPLLVNAVASERSEILFMEMGKLLTLCPGGCSYHNRLIQNLLTLTARKNLTLSRRILHTSAKSIRGRLLSYFSEQALLQGGYRFSIPFNRQQLADYLGVDRSALSNELSKMKREGLIAYEKNTFILTQA